MAIEDILVHMDNSPHCAARLDVAIRLAQRHGANLTGLYAVSHAYYQPRHGAFEISTENIHKLFDAKVADTGINAQWNCVDWSVIGVNISEIINHHAHYTDLVVLGQAMPGADETSIPADLPERVVAGAGRPVLIVPYAGAFKTIGERILVAWKAGRESTRAVNDALPFLKQAQRVNLLAANSSDDYGDDSEILCANISAHMARHGIKAVAEQVHTAHLSIGDALLNRVCEEGFDLLVMGAYARTPQGTLVIGAVARHLLDHMTVPVLMSH
jgi:nucleotide-binding universal stress UspA family protein